MNLKKGLCILGMGILVGTASAGGGMLLSQREASAAVLVYDAANVEQAIKTAIQTASILTETQKQLALAILNIKSLNPQVLLNILQSQQNASQDFLSGDMRLPPSVLRSSGKAVGILNANTTAVSILQNEIGTVTDVLDGNKTMIDAAADTQKNIKALEASYTDAAQTAQSARSASEKLTHSVNQALEASQNAEGQMQVLQAQVAVSAANYMETRNTNNLLSSLLATEAQKAYVENRERAVAIRTSNEIGNSLKSYVKTFSSNDN